MHAGDVLARAGDRLGDAAALSAGLGRPRRGRGAPPRAAHVLVTGDELLPLARRPSPGTSTKPTASWSAASPAPRAPRSHDLGVIGDDREATIAAVREGLEGDVLVVSGGVSVGAHDHVKAALEACGVEELFWRVRIKPGKPLWFGRRGDTLVFGLPGNPLSAIVCFGVFVGPALRRLQGEHAAGPRLVKGRLAVPAGPSDTRTTFLTSRLAPARRRARRRRPSARART